MKLKASNSDDDSKNFEKLVAKRRKLANSKKNTITKVSASDYQLDDTINNFNEAKQYAKKI